MVNGVKVFVLKGDGINCQQETGRCFSELGAQVQYFSLNDWVSDKKNLLDFDIFVLPGGFSFGDELGSGQVLANQLKALVMDQVFDFYEKKGLILGICNGFQVLTKLGLLPFAQNTASCALTFNRDRLFIDRWEPLQINSQSVCVWTSGMKGKISMPVRHGEGRLLFEKGVTLPKEQQVFWYENDINGSTDQIAGVTDPRGQILGLMPHPEGTFYKGFDPEESHFSDLYKLGVGSEIFKNAIHFCQKLKGVQ